VYRQGDILLIRSTAEPTFPYGIAERQHQDGRLVLAHGATTGHNHAVKGQAELYPMPDSQDRLLVMLVDGALVHEEHGAIELSAGSYTVRRQREYSPEAIRDVQD
jgi:hypothetical protein